MNKNNISTKKLTITEVMDLVRKYYALPGNGAGGSLHVVLDDGNIKDSDISFCVGYAKKVGDTEGAKLGEIILGMSRTQRIKLYNDSLKYEI